MNFIQLNVQMANQAQTINADIPSVTWDTLFSNLGGTLNLWMGITVLFAAEVVEVIFHILMLRFSKQPQATNQDRDPEKRFEKNETAEIKTHDKSGHFEHDNMSIQSTLSTKQRKLSILHNGKQGYSEADTVSVSSAHKD